VERALISAGKTIGKCNTNGRRRPQVVALVSREKREEKHTVLVRAEGAARGDQLQEGRWVGKWS
jgi:hypothetical protein